MQALYIDHDSDRCAVIARWFEAHHYSLDCSPSIGQALQLVDLGRYDIALIEQDSQQVSLVDAIQFVSRMEDAHGVIVDDLSNLANMDPLLAIAQATTAEMKPGKDSYDRTQKLVEIMQRVCQLEHDINGE